MPRGLRLLFVRHAETDWNKAGRYQGCIDTRLSEAGRQQAVAVAERLRSLRLARVYTSPQARARETAEAIARPLDLPLFEDRAFVERCHGEWEGLTVDEIEARFPGALRKRREDPLNAVSPEGESLAAVRDRVLDRLARLEADHREETVCIVLHDAPLKMMLLNELGLGPESFWKLRLSSTGLSEIEIDGRRRQISRINDTSHLSGPLVPEPHRAL